MNTSNPRLDWRALAEDEQEMEQSESAWQVQASESTSSVLYNHLQNIHTPRRLYELILGFAFLYGIAVFLIWQHSEQRISTIEEELNELQSELPLSTSKIDEDRVTTDDILVDQHHIQTQYLHFISSDIVAEVVQKISKDVNTKYQQLHADFDLTISTMDKLKIYVDNAPPSLNNEGASHAVFISIVDSATYGLEAALATELSMRLAEKVVQKVTRGRTFPSEWQAMTIGLSAFIHRENGHNTDWKLEEIFLHRRHMARNYSIARVQRTVLRPSTPMQEAPSTEIRQPDNIAYDVADPLIEYILDSYGYSTVPKLLDAFEAHSSWETLAPAVFNIPASEFEARWHDFLQERYPVSSQ